MPDDHPQRLSSEGHQLTQENWDAKEGQKARVALCNDKIRKALQEFDCALRVPSLDISTGRVIPEIILVPAPHSPKPSDVITPNGRR